MARRKLGKSVEAELEDDNISTEERQDSESFKGADAAFAELRRAPEVIEKPIAESAKRESPHRQILDFLEEFRKATVNIVFAGIIGLLVLTVIKVINIDELAIDPVTLPKAIKDLGFTEEGVALSLSDNMFKIFETSDVYKRTFNVKAKIEEGDFAVPVAGLSFGSAIRLIRQLAGFPQRHISGEIVCSAEPCNAATMELHLRVMDGIHQPNVLPAVKGESVDAVLVAGAEKLLRVADPMSLAAYYFDVGGESKPRRAEAIAIAKDIAVGRSGGGAAINGQDQAVAFNILAMDSFSRSTGNDDQFEYAVGLIEAAIKANPEYVPSYSNLGAMLSARGHFEDASAKYKEALRRENLPWLRRDLARTYFENRQYAEAEVEFSSLVQTNARDYESINGLGAVLMQNGNLKGAMEQFSRAISVNPDFPDAHCNLGLAHKSEGDLVDAKASFGTCLKLAAEGSQLKANAQRLIDQLDIKATN